MDPVNQEFYESIIGEYRQALADAQYALAQANAQGKAKDRIITELTILAEANTPDEPETPKPGPR